jgi:hypothetical protein
MTASSNEALKAEAITAVLLRLGESMFVMLKLTLAQDYKINLDRNDSYTIEELQIALQRIVGPDGSSLLVREIRNEIRMLAEQQIH